MKRFLFILLFVFVFLIGMMAIIPLFFKNTISEQLKTEINKNIEGKVNFAEFHISMFNQFPKVELQVINFSITGNNEFKNDTLVSVGELTGAITLSELLKSKSLKITRLHASQTNVLLKTIEGGAANWNLVPTTSATNEKTSAAAKTTDDKSGVKIMLDDVKLDHFNLKYLDEPSKMVIALSNLSAQSKGEINGDKMNFDIQTNVDELLFKYGSVPYVSNTRLKVNTQLLFDTDQMNFSFHNGQVWLNDLLLKLDGSFAMPSDSMYFDLQLNNDSKSFKDLLALVPASYQSYLEKVEADGSASLSAGVKGWYYGDNYPAFQFDATVSNAKFHYTDLPEQIEQINLKAVISKPQGDLDLLVIDLPKASASLQGIPVNASLQITSPMSDPHYKASFDGQLDFKTLSQTLPMQGINLQGQLLAHLSLQGQQSDIDSEAYDRFQSDGTISLDNFAFRSENLKQAIQIKTAEIAITTPRVEIKKWNGNIGESHFVLNGYLSNYLPYFTKNGILKGDFSLNSDFINLTELATIQNQLTTQNIDSTTVSTTNAPSDSILAFEVPERLDLKFRSSIKKARFDKMDVSTINGLITVKGQTLALDQLKMQMLQGTLAITGSYIGNPQLQPDFSCRLEASDFDVRSAYQSLQMIRRYLPIAARSQGKLSTSLQMEGKMNEKLELIAPSLDGNGTLSTRNLMVIDDPTFSQLKGIIKSEKLKNVKVDDFTARFRIDKGNIQVTPFTTKIAGQETTVQGRLSVESKLDFKLDFKLNREDLGSDINKGLELIPGSENIQKIDTGVKITGTLKKPEVGIDLESTRKQMMEEVKKASMKELQNKAKKIGNELKKLFK